METIFLSNDNTEKETTHSDGKQETEPRTMEISSPPIYETITAKQDIDNHLNIHIKTFVQRYAEDLIKSKQYFTPIHVDEIASRIARIYERIRKVIDWKDDNALRRGSIERILKRIFFPKMAGFAFVTQDVKMLAEKVTLELIRSGHLPNDTVPRERIADVARAFRKYLFFLNFISKNPRYDVKRKSNFTTFILELAACEIEEILTNPIKEQGIATAMSQILDDRIYLIPEDTLDPHIKLKLCEIATQRVLYDLDDNYITYQLLKGEYPFWQNPTDEQIQEILKDLPHIQVTFHDKVRTQMNGKFDSVAEKIDTVFIILDDILEELKEKPEEILPTLEDKKTFIKLFSKYYDKRHKTLKTRLMNLAIFSTLSVFLSNWVTFFIVEVPLAHIFYEGFNLFAAAIDFLVPTAIMFILVALIKAPGPQNKEKVLDAALGFIYTDEGQEHYQINVKGKNTGPFRIFMVNLYTITMLGVFTLVAYIFYIAGLPITSVIFDTFSIALNIFAAVVIRNQSKELNVDESTSLDDFLLDVITVPVAKVGAILARKWKEWNFVSIFFNFVIETPLAAILDFIQGWSEFIKERRSELR